MNNKVKAGLKTLAVFGVAGISSALALFAISHVPPVYLAIAVLVMAMAVGVNTVYNYFLTMSEASDKVNSLIDKIK